MSKIPDEVVASAIEAELKAPASPLGFEAMRAAAAERKLAMADVALRKAKAAFGVVKRKRSDDKYIVGACDEGLKIICSTLAELEKADG